jgi:hypothetical protein
MKKEKVEKDDKGGVDRHYQQLWGKKKGATKPKKRKKFKKMKEGAPITITSTCENAQKESGIT